MKMLRNLLFLLLATNLLLLLWKVVESAAGDQLQQHSARPPETLMHISEQSRHLLSEYPAVQDRSEVSLVLAPPQVELLPSSCLVRGSFVSDSAALAAVAGANFLFTVRSLRREVPESLLYRAMIAPSLSREEALFNLSEAAAAISRIGGGIDTYLVTSGPIANAVSLGLFSEQSNALKVQALLAGEGVDVVIEPEIRVEVSYWVVLGDRNMTDIIEENEIFEGFEVASAELSQNLCERIAQAEQFP